MNKQNVRLYIDDKLVDFSEELSMPFTYTLKDVNNPSIVKNPFTKSIDIIGTDNNNKIFGEIYKFDREQMFDATKLVGAYFNPSVRTPFSIFRNGELIESGYMQLNNINIKGKDISYNITLYGGLGNFFYSLMYSEDGEQLTLADLVYGVEDATGNVLDSENELDFTINGAFVKNCFGSLGNMDNNTIYDYITFIPSYNGLPENFSSDKVLIHTYKNNYWNGTTGTTVDKVTYKPYNNFVLANLSRKYTETEMLDLRSYLQRPAIKMSKIIDACCNPTNNGGYNVELDSDFFNDDNPYYKDAWIALPLLGKERNDKNEVISSVGRLYNNNLNVGLYNGSSIGTKTDYLIPISNFTVNSGTINYNSVPVGTLTDVEVSFNILYKCESDVDDLTLTKVKATSQKPSYGKSKLRVQIVATTDTNEVISKSENVWFSSDKINSQFDSILGTLKKQTTNNYTFVSENNNTIFTTSLKNIPYHSKLNLQIQFQYDIDDYGIFDYGQTNADGEIIDGYFTISPIEISISRDEPDNAIGSNTLITKKSFLKTDKSPADYLLSYTKLFNLYYTIDETNKTIKIHTMNNYFNGNVLDWSNKIDYSKDVKIKPLMFDKKFYRMKSEGENHYVNKYKNEYSVEYGQKRINTNYNFNADTQEVFDGNVYQNSVTILDTSPYYHTFRDKDDNALTPFENNNYKYSLFNVATDDVIKKTEVEYTSPVIVGGTPWNRKSGYDLFAKPCFYNLENGEKSLSDISSVLLFYNGNVKCNDMDGVSIKYYITDDIQEMFTLNDNTPCWLFTDYPNKENGETLAYEIASLPQFSRYKIVGNQVQASWDFGKPKEIYIPDITYDDNKTIYNQFWESYYNDQLNINTKEITCYVNLVGDVVNSELLRNFYYFNGCYWLLNKIENYNINSTDTTKCTFIRINNLNNYTDNVGGV